MEKMESCRRSSAQSNALTTRPLENVASFVVGRVARRSKLGALKPPPLGFGLRREVARIYVGRPRGVKRTSAQSFLRTAKSGQRQTYERPLPVLNQSSEPQCGKS